MIERTACVFCDVSLLDSEQNPKLLPCLHSACQDCVSNAVLEYSGKNGLSVSDADTGLCKGCSILFKTADVLDGYLLMEQPPDSTGPYCTSCDNDNSAPGYCPTCKEYLCKDCIVAHYRVRITRDHQVQYIDDVPPSELPKQPPKRAKRFFCPKHTQEELKIFCMTCSVLTCRDCQLEDHKSHTYRPMVLEAQYLRNFLRLSLDELSKLSVDIQLLSVANEEEIKNVIKQQEHAEKALNNCQTRLCEAVENRKSSLLSEVYNNVKFRNYIQYLKRCIRKKQELKKQTENCYKLARYAICKANASTVCYSKNMIIKRMEFLGDPELGKTEMESEDAPKLELSVNFAAWEVQRLITNIANEGVKLQILETDDQADGEGNGFSNKTPINRPPPAKRTPNYIQRSMSYPVTSSLPGNVAAPSNSSEMNATRRNSIPEPIPRTILPRCDIGTSESTTATSTILTLVNAGVLPQNTRTASLLSLPVGGQVSVPVGVVPSQQNTPPQLVMTSSFSTPFAVLPQNTSQQLNTPVTNTMPPSLLINSSQTPPVIEQQVSGYLPTCANQQQPTENGAPGPVIIGRNYRMPFSSAQTWNSGLQRQRNFQRDLQPRNTNPSTTNVLPAPLPTYALTTVGQPTSSLTIRPTVAPQPNLVSNVHMVPSPTSLANIYPTTAEPPYNALTNSNPCNIPASFFLFSLINQNRGEISSTVPQRILPRTAESSQDTSNTTTSTIVPSLHSDAAVSSRCFPISSPDSSPLLSPSQSFATTTTNSSRKESRTRRDSSLSPTVSSSTNQDNENATLNVDPVSVSEEKLSSSRPPDSGVANHQTTSKQTIKRSASSQSDKQSGAHISQNVTEVLEMEVLVSSTSNGEQHSTSLHDNSEINVPATEEDVQATEKHDPVTEEYEQATEENVPATEKHVPATVEEVPATERHVSATGENAPAEKENVLAIEKNVPATEGNVPATEGNVPAEEENVLATEKHVIAIEKNVPATKENLAAMEKNDNRFNPNPRIHLPALKPIFVDYEEPVQCSICDLNLGDFVCCLSCAHFYHEECYVYPLPERGDWFCLLCTDVLTCEIPKQWNSNRQLSGRDILKCQRLLLELCTYDVVPYCGATKRAVNLKNIMKRISNPTFIPYEEPAEFVEDIKFVLESHLEDFNIGTSEYVAVLKLKRFLNDLLHLYYPDLAKMNRKRRAETDLVSEDTHAIRPCKHPHKIPTHSILSEN